MTLGITGHRPDKLLGYGPETRERLKIFAMSCLLHYKPEKVVVGMALGWDTAVALACIDLGIPYIAAVPFRGQEKMWKTEDQVLYKMLLDNAQAIVYVCEEGYAAWKMHKRNEWMVNSSDEMLALWDMVDEGGTAACLRYARKQHRMIHNVWYDFLTYKLELNAQACTDEGG